MKKAFWLVCLIFSFVLIEYSEAQNEDKKLLFQKFLEQYNAGDLVKAENTLRIFLQSKIPLTNGQFIAAYSNLGAIEISLGRYDRALEYNLKAESLISKNDQNSLDLAAVYNNRGYIYNIMKSYDVAIEYLEKSIRIYLNMGSGNKTYLDNLEQVYINISIAYQETKQYS